MKLSQILYKAILKATINGFLVPKNAYNSEIYVSEDLKDITIIWDFYQDAFDFGKGPERIECIPDCCGKNRNKNYSVNDIIFDVKFAKAFFGESEIVTPEGLIYKSAASNALNTIANFPNLMIWDYHRKQMFASDAPLQYLEAFV